MISIVVTFYNEEQSIISCLQSLVAQTAQQWECVIVDNGSTDAGEFQVRSYLIDRRMRLVHLDQRLPVWEARRRGLALTSGEWVVYLDGADYLESNALQALYLAVKKYGTQCAVGNYYVLHNGEKQVVSHLADCKLTGQQIVEGRMNAVTGNSIFSRSVAFEPEQWPALDFGYTEHVILVSGGREEPLVSQNTPSWWERFRRLVISSFSRLVACI